ncbi:uncharacterized protein BDR25DRAFT_247182 [Lindgomyces ingoldianus]|uniref:Uncharacterized protein n=1 Tax=Lindgomyces ingoldianus TaxID=673940 RepID=A0ACB6Q7L0_9PLEO|nr:uncharacterized protein BDR25DRAFT_247182 [Lindgomyces ingoldianus]KAF2462913.1 hypothetical protein BDR25DRAFT_247182 [Lindgomyces ingoldianus]
MKRQNPSIPSEGRKKQRCQEPNSKALALKEIESVSEQAKPYQLATAKFPIDALTPEWTVGGNRSINEAHKQRLCEIFSEQGLLRRDPGHRLRIACTKEQVKKMLDHLSWKQAQDGHVAAAREDMRGEEFEWPSFEEWDMVVGEKAELMAGNHRVEALKKRLRLLGCGNEERWWICDIYDKDALPLHLRIKLRANREDLILPDNHGQIWTELATLSSSDNTLFQGPKTDVEREMLEHLRLSGPVKFPVRRLCTLWRNQNWKRMITRWCEFSLGQATFNISTFEWMASCRIDDVTIRIALTLRVQQFWFTTFHSVIDSISRIRSEFSIDVQSSDWIKLASLPQIRKPADVQQLFYPNLENQNKQKDVTLCRQRNFFLTAGDDVYDRLYRFVLSTPDLGFADVHSLLKTTKQEGKVMSIVMSHVGQWLNRDPARVGERDNNKPLLRKDLLPALREKCGDDAEKQSIKLQERLLGYVRDKMSDFTSPAMEHYLHEYPDNTRDAYAKRFEHQAWRDMLILVVELAGPHLQHECLVQFNTKDPREISSKPASAIAQAVCKSISCIPEVAQNPALREKSAADDLCKIMELVIAKWAAKQCAEALECHSKEWQPSTVRLIEAERAKYDALLEEMRPVSPFFPSPSVFQSIALSEAHGGNDVICDSGSCTHESHREHATTQRSKDGVTASSCKTENS